MLAIIIPYYKIAFFDETLKSLSSQTDKRFKVYIGNDASPENPDGLLKEYKGKFDFEYQLFAENLGKTSLTKQWERCIALSESEKWIMILGDDDVLGNNVVETFYKNLLEFNENANVVRFASKIIEEKSGTITASFLHPEWEKSSDSYFRKFNFATRSSLSEYVFLSDSYERYKFRNYPLAWHSDDMAWFDFSNTKSIFSINESVVFIRVSDDSISGKKDNAILKNQATLEFLKDLLKEKLQLFKKKQRLDLLLMYEVELKKNQKITFTEYSFLLKFYLQNFNFIQLSKFVRRIFMNLI